MKKFYTLLAVALFSFGTNAQTATTLTSHFSPALVNPASPAIAVYSWEDDGGFVSGTNAYGDKGAIQLFDAAYGVTGSGVITNVKVFAPIKDGTGSITVGIWDNPTSGNPTLLGSKVVDLADIDTVSANTGFLLDGTTLLGLYNVDVTFDTPIAIPANQSFFAGILFPTESGAAIAVLTTDGDDYVFTDAETHAGAILSDGAFDNYGQYNVMVSLAVFPTIMLGTSVSVDATSKLNFSASPNPANDVLTITADEAITSVVVTNLEGKVVANSSNGIVQVSELTAGLYIYTATTVNGNIATNKFVKK